MVLFDRRSAHWCPPCRMFTPKLRQTYLQLKAAGKDFEVVFCSFDRSQKDFESGVYNSDGRTSVMMNPQGFPWK